MQIGTLVKLVRVLMLGPVVLALSLGGSDGTRPPVHRLVPWFILGFLAMAGLRSAGLLPPAVLLPLAQIATLLTILSMAALGLGVDIWVVAKAGPRVTTAVTVSLLVLAAIAYGLIRLIRRCLTEPSTGFVRLALRRL